MIEWKFSRGHSSGEIKTTGEKKNSDITNYSKTLMRHNDEDSKLRCKFNEQS